MRKNIDISDEAVKAITIQAVHEGTVFKLKAEQNQPHKGAELVGEIN